MSRLTRALLRRSPVIRRENIEALQYEVRFEKLYVQGLVIDDQDYRIGSHQLPRLNQAGHRYLPLARGID